MSLHHMMEQDLSIFVQPILTLSPLALFATTILAARSNTSTTLKPVSAEHSAKLAALISFCTSIISLYLKKEARPMMSYNCCAGVSLVDTDEGVWKESCDYIISDL